MVEELDVIFALGTKIYETTRHEVWGRTMSKMFSEVMDYFSVRYNLEVKKGVRVGGHTNEKIDLL